VVTNINKNFIPGYFIYFFFVDFHQFIP